MPRSREDLIALIALRSRPYATNRQVGEEERDHGGAAAAAARLLPRCALDTAATAIERVERGGVRLLDESDPEYPDRLREIDDHPLALFVHGRLDAADHPTVAVVGSRRASAEGRRIARALGQGLATLGVTVASGLARGIDGEAHRGTLEGAGRTLAVLGSGIDVVYPPEHKDLARQVAASGAVLSELAPGARPEKLHFPMRNRILAGLASVVVVVEAAERSGSLITARLAADYHREVLAVPGSPLDPAHAGTNRIIQDFAGMLLTLQDVIDHLPAGLRPRPAPRRTVPPAAAALSAAGQRVLSVLSPREPLHLDQIAERAGTTGGEAASLLVELELGERVSRLPGGRYVRSEPPGAFQAPAAARGDTPCFPVLSSLS